jgi:lipopolysaccharide transport system ATP-binding protein
MTKTVISVENLSKSYRLGQIGTGTLSRDLEVWWAKVRGKPNPMLKIGQTDHGNQDGQTLWALSDVSFQVQQGEVLGIIGRNGAGKSTLLKILSRVTAPTSGQVKVKGRIASLLEVGTGFHPELTGRENIFLNGAILGMSKQEVQRKFDEIVSFAEVEKFVDTPVKRYSSGMYVRLAFAVAAHLESEILLVDEVLAVGDAEFQKKCLGKMGDVAALEGRTVFFVSHNMAAIQTLCSSCCLIERGNLIDIDTPSITINKYLKNNQNLGIIKRETNFIKWLGMPEKKFDIDQDISIDLPFIVGDKDLESITLALAISKMDGLKIIRLQTELITKGYHLQANKKYIFAYSIDKPNLAPGEYFIEIYLNDSNTNIFWAQQIPGFEISTKTHSNHIRLFYDRVGIIMPNFSINLKKID